MKCFSFSMLSQINPADMAVAFSKYVNLGTDGMAQVQGNTVHTKYSMTYEAFHNYMSGKCREPYEPAAWETTCKKNERMSEKEKKKREPSLVSDEEGTDAIAQGKSLDGSVTMSGAYTEGCSAFDKSVEAYGKMEMDYDCKIALSFILDLRDELLVEEGIDIVALLRRALSDTYDSDVVSTLRNLFENYEFIGDYVKTFLESAVADRKSALDLLP